MTIRIGITGAAGRMGRTLIEAIGLVDGLTLAAAIERPECTLLGADSGELAGQGKNGVAVVGSLAAVITDIDVLIDFSVPDATMANLVTSLEEAMVYREDVSCQNKQIQAKIEEVKRFVAQSFENIAGAIGQLEKDVEEEFQVTTQLKDGTEKLVEKLRKDKNSNYVSDVENLLGDVRMIQSWQLSHFELINKVVTENKDQVRNIQLL